MASTDKTERDRWRYEDNRLFCNEQYVAVLEAKDGDESTCEYIAKALDDYGRAIADYEAEIDRLRAANENLIDERKAISDSIVAIADVMGREGEKLLAFGSADD